MERILPNAISISKVMQYNLLNECLVNGGLNHEDPKVA